MRYWIKLLVFVLLLVGCASTSVSPVYDDAELLKESDFSESLSDEIEQLERQIADLNSSLEKNEAVLNEKYVLLEDKETLLNEKDLLIEELGRLRSEVELERVISVAEFWIESIPVSDRALTPRAEDEIYCGPYESYEGLTSSEARDLDRLEFQKTGRFNPCNAPLLLEKGFFVQDGHGWCGLSNPNPNSLDSFGKPWIAGEGEWFRGYYKPDLEPLEDRAEGWEDRGRFVYMKEIVEVELDSSSPGKEIFIRFRCEPWGYEVSPIGSSWKFDAVAVFKGNTFEPNLLDWFLVGDGGTAFIGNRLWVMITDPQIGDATCCPSIARHFLYEFSDGQFVLRNKETLKTIDASQDRSYVPSNTFVNFLKDHEDFQNFS